MEAEELLVVGLRLYVERGVDGMVDGIHGLKVHERTLVEIIHVVLVREAQNAQHSVKVDRGGRGHEIAVDEIVAL
jgi:hypothetical protein